MTGSLNWNSPGTLDERIRAGGAGIPAFYTKTGVGTVVAESKSTEEFEGEHYLRQRWLRAGSGDHPVGNLIYRKTARNFNPVKATAAKVTTVEVEEVVERGALDPDAIHMPAIYADRVILGHGYEKRIEKPTTRPPRAETV